MIGDRCFVVRIRPGSDAEKKGVKPGDELVALNGFSPNRESFWRMQYFFNTLHPEPELRLDLRNPGGETRQVDLVATVIKKKPILDLTAGDGSNDIWEVIRQEENEDHDERIQFAGVGDVGVLKFPSFFADASEVDSMIGKARKYETLVLDLRGDPGGSVDTLKYLIGDCFDKQVKIGDLVGRSKQKPMIAKNYSNPFTGKLVVLVDSKSASAAELFARVVQIEKRGTVLGDRSAGSVMEARRYSYKSGVETVVFYGASITMADIVMTDGKSLEHQGVVPDELMLPSAEDLANGRDPVLAHAMEIAGAKITPEAAGKLFPYEWPAL
jgi:carboxyl-terminal processing protease